MRQAIGQAKEMAFIFGHVKYYSYLSVMIGGRDRRAPPALKKN
jgi:hypothetical protein